MKKILVIGSTNADLIAGVDRFPTGGETLRGNFFLQAMGGKGANQAMAAQRLGGHVKFVTCVGDDDNGRSAIRYYKENGLDVSAAITVNDAPTGTAVILVNASGENCIISTPGANEKLSPGYVERLEEDIRHASHVVLQMEIPLSTIETVCGLARKYSTPIVLNVAPARKISKELLTLIDILVVNENEIEVLSEMAIATVGAEAAIDSLRAVGINTVILTLGEKGSMAKDDRGTYLLPAFQVNAIDTTAAGDTFCGALVAQLSLGVLLKDALKFATAASALCVTRLGAQPSIPSEAEVNEFLNANPSFRSISA